MRPRHLMLRGLVYYWRTHAAVVLGVATASAVLSGALLVGDSVRGSLRDLVLQRLGRTDLVVASAGFFRDDLDNRIRSNPAFASNFASTTPLLVVRGFVTHQESGRRAGQVRVYGVDARFWTFHGVDALDPPLDREALLSPALAAQLDARPGDTVLLRVQRPSDVPLESLHGRKDDPGHTVRLEVRETVPTASLGEFSMEAQQGEVAALFVPLERLQNELGLDRRVNTVLVSAQLQGTGAAAVLEDIVRSEAALDDLGLTLRTLDRRGVVVLESQTGLLDDVQVAAAGEAARASAVMPRTILTYLANVMRHADREVPYSLVTASDLVLGTNGAASATNDLPSIVLNDWAARELAAAPGDEVSLEYFVWEDPGQLVTRTTRFQVSAVVPLVTGDPDLAPVYPGITDSTSLANWEPPFPIDLRRVRPVDEAYWEEHRTTPKAFIPLETGQRLWSSRYGAVTSIRLAPPEGRSLDETREGYGSALLATLDPLAAGLAVRDVRAEGLGASRGATNFGEYFVYFSFFLVVAALLLAALFFKLGIEQRAREVGLLRALGYSPGLVRRLFMLEGVLLALAGGLLGALGGIGYGALVMQGLRSWWNDAAGTTLLTLHVSVTSLAAGAAGAVAAAAICIWWTLRDVGRVSDRALLAGQLAVDAGVGTAGLRARNRRLRMAAVALALCAGGLPVAAAAGLIAREGAFFGAGAALLVLSLCLFALMLRGHPGSTLGGQGWRAVSRLGLRSAAYRPGRSIISVAVTAAATFILISVDAFRRAPVAFTDDVRSGMGGYALMVETLLPVVHDPNTRDGRIALNLTGFDATAIAPFRLLPGDDASCLNLYAPANPRILAPSDAFIAEGRFSFQSSLAGTDGERRNPWLLLDRTEPDGAVPVIGDANSITYVLHRKLGDDVVITRGNREIRLRLVAALRDSIFQGELLMSASNFQRLFPEQQGYQLLLFEAGPDAVDQRARELENTLADFGADATGTAERLATFHRVENTYLSTFQTLGALGLLLGTIGLGTVVLRSVLERRRELALLGAVGYQQRHFLLMVMAESGLLLAAGLAAGAASAGLAVLPAMTGHAGRIPWSSGAALLLFAVLASGLLSSAVAARAATSGRLLAALRAE